MKKYTSPSRSRTLQVLVLYWIGIFVLLQTVTAMHGTLHRGAAAHEHARGDRHAHVHVLAHDDAAPHAHAPGDAPSHVHTHTHAPTDAGWVSLVVHAGDGASNGFDSAAQPFLPSDERPLPQHACPRAPACASPRIAPPAPRAVLFDARGPPHLA